MWNPFKKQQALEAKSRAMFFGLPPHTGIGNDFMQLATEGYAQNAVANACITKIANAIASVDLDAFIQSEGKLVKKDEHPLEELLERPNQTQSGKAFIRDMVTQYLIGGNAFILAGSLDDDMKSPPSSLYLLSPAKVEIVMGDKMPTAYKYKPTPDSQAVTYPIDPLRGTGKVLHLKTPNPLNEWLGLAPMQAAAYGIDIFNAGMKWNKKLLDNDCRPAGALVMKDASGNSAALNDQQYLRLKEEIETQFSGASNAGRPLLLEGGLDWRELSISPKDMDYRENILMAARFIASVFHVPPQLVNIPGESTYSNYEQAEMSFWNDTVIPLLTSLLEDLNRWLSPLYKDGAFMWYDEESVTALEPLRRMKSERLNASSYLSINEKRYAMGFEAMEGGNEVLVESGKVPLSLLDATMQENG